MILDEILNDLYLKIHTVDDARDLVDEIMWREINAHVAAEREACAALHDSEDVLAPVGQSAWGEAYQDGWTAGVSAYREAIRARGNP